MTEYIIVLLKLFYAQYTNANIEIAIIQMGRNTHNRNYSTIRKLLLFWIIDAKDIYVAILRTISIALDSGGWLSKFPLNRFEIHQKRTLNSSESINFCWSFWCLTRNNLSFLVSLSDPFARLLFDAVARTIFHISKSVRDSCTYTEKWCLFCCCRLLLQTRCSHTPPRVMSSGFIWSTKCGRIQTFLFVRIFVDFFLGYEVRISFIHTRTTHVILSSAEIQKADSREINQKCNFRI